jgi:outer membrane protein assembly factor BamB
MRIFWCSLLALVCTSACLPQSAAADHPVLAQDKGHVVLVGADGKTEWEVECPQNSHDIWLLPSGNLLLHTGAAKVVEMTKEKKVVWEYTAKPKTGYDGAVEVHAFQRLPDGNTMVAESGNRRIVEIDPSGKIVREMALQVDNPHPHRDTRMVRKLDNGHYLVCHEGDGCVREYDLDGKVIWTYKLDLAGRPRSDGHGPEGHGTEVFGALRLKNGNTLIACGNGNRVIEVNPAGETVWALEQKDLPGITLAWVTTLHSLPSGDIILGNCHAGPENPQLVQVTRDKKVVWTFKDFERFGNSLAVAHVLGLPDGTLR